MVLGVWGVWSQEGGYGPGSSMVQGYGPRRYGPRRGGGSMACITSICGHFTYIETLWKLWNDVWNDPMEMFCFRHTFFLWPHMVSCGDLEWNFYIRWRWSIWKSPITMHLLYLVMYSFRLNSTCDLTKLCLIPSIAQRSVNNYKIKLQEVNRKYIAWEHTITPMYEKE